MPKMWLLAWDFRSACRRLGFSEESLPIRFGWWLGRVAHDPDL